MGTFLYKKFVNDEIPEIMIILLCIKWKFTFLFPTNVLLPSHPSVRGRTAVYIVKLFRNVTLVGKTKQGSVELILNFKSIDTVELQWLEH